MATVADQGISHTPNSFEYRALCALSCDGIFDRAFASGFNPQHETD
jgi:hypothetical protein